MKASLWDSFPPGVRYHMRRTWKYCCSTLWGYDRYPASAYSTRGGLIEQDGTWRAWWSSDDGVQLDGRGLCRPLWNIAGLSVHRRDLEYNGGTSQRPFKQKVLQSGSTQRPSGQKAYFPNRVSSVVKNWPKLKFTNKKKNLFAPQILFSKAWC